LLDAGSITLADPVRRCIGPFLRHRGKASIEEIWLSHSDYDHTSAAADLIRVYGVDRIVTRSEFARHAGDNPANEFLFETIGRQRIAVGQLKQHERIDLGKDVSVEVLWPPLNGQFDSNDSGLVLKLTYARRTILFPADIQHAALSGLLRTPERLRCDVLIAPHHGSSEPTTASFIEAADPLYVISSNDRTLSQKQRLFARQVGERNLLRTNECGAIEIRIDPTGGLVVTPFLQTRRD
jgi:competence protein ComEC